MPAKTPRNNAKKILGYDIGVQGQGLPDPNGTEVQAMVFYPNFGVMAFFPFSQFVSVTFADWGFNGKEIRENTLIENTANGGSVEYTSRGVELKTNTGTPGGEASICVEGWADGGEQSLFDHMEHGIIQISHEGLSSSGFLGDAEWCIGQFEQENGILNHTKDDVKSIKGWWIHGDGVSGTMREYLVTSTGEGSVDNVSVVEITAGGGPNFASDRILYMKFTQGEDGPSSISAWRGIGGNEAMATITDTDTLPSGVCNTTNNARFTATIKNGASDSGDRTIVFYNNKLLNK